MTYIHGAFVFIMINYTGQSMNPTLIDGDRLNIRPYGDQRIRAGDIVVFQHPFDGYLMVHRVVSAERHRIRTRGDNNSIRDRFVLSYEDITGRVVSAHRGRNKIKVPGGIPGRLQGAMRHLIKYLDLKISRFLHHQYRRLAKTGIFRKIFAPCIKTRTVCLRRKNGTELQVLMGRRIIARLPAGADRWQIKRPFRIMIDETTLPELKSLQDTDRGPLLSVKSPPA